MTANLKSAIIDSHQYPLDLKTDPRMTFPYQSTKTVVNFDHFVGTLFHISGILIKICKTSWRARRCPWEKKFGEKIVEEKIFEKKFEFLLPKTLPGHPWVSTQNFSPFGLAVWQAIGNIYVYECLVLLYRVDYIEQS